MVCLVPCIEAADSSILGVVEEASVVGSSTGELQTHLRLGFFLTDEGWRAACKAKPNDNRNETCDLHEPERLRKWYVWCNGKKIGQVSTSGWVNSAYYSKSGLLRITSTPIPRVGKRVEAFAGWDADKKYRPLVALVGMSPGKVAPWTYSNPSAKDVAAVWPAFRQIIPEIPMCEKGNLSGPSTPITQKHLEIFRVIRSDSGEKLLGVRVARRFFKHCDGWGGFASDLWFFLAPDSQPRLISRPPQLDGWSSSQDLIDIGDFDGDGKIEALFWFSGYNEDGYVLYSEEFERSTTFTWGYH